ncbi:hypothetical protein [Iningainema tapete]|uniref:Aspartate racemase n=1 Tax=Iningainema tapete BLCC-T55 TaxID=2748662 RepID=A0A8J6XLG8_9CYAN|nr:hypothetical protein [Iningainema tapete]MBD2773824.1 hypothetical protein [Iningainema tapete BLCC-T55]
MKKLLGILGGMEPLASAEFLQTIYEENLTDIEQELPACILYSDLTFGDCTEAILAGTEEILIKHLESCTELHLITKYFIKCQVNKDYKIVDPLLKLAKDFWRFIDA